MANDINCGNEQSPPAANYTEQLMHKFDELTLSEKLHKDNKKVASNLFNRSSSGVLQTMDNFIGAAL